MPFARKQSGFTLIEILVVVAILAILTTFVTLNIMDQPDEARRVRAQQDIQRISAALDMYRLDNFVYPTTEQSLRALVERPSGQPEAPNWRTGGYLNQLPKDPWNREYQYLNPGRRGPFDVISFGADGRPGGDGRDADIGNWPD